MNNPHDQDREWELVQAILGLRKSGTSSFELTSMETELLSRFNADIAETADVVRSKYGNYKVYQQDPPEQGDLENHLRLWLLQNAVAEYNPLKSDSFAMFVFNGWWMEKGGCIQQYVKQFGPQEGVELDRDGKPKKGVDGKLIKHPVRMGSLDGEVKSVDGEARPLGHVVSQGRQFVGGGLAEEPSHDGLEIQDVLDAVARQASLTPERMLEFLKPLAFPHCKPDETDEHRRREAMLVLLRDDLSCPDCSNEFQRRQWWNSLVDGSE